MRLTFLGSSGLQPKATVSQRALPLAKALVRRGHDVTLVVPPYDDPASAGIDYLDSGVRVIQLRLGAGLAGLPLSLAAAAATSRPDLVHVFKPTGPSGAAAMLLGRSIPVMLDCDDWEGRGGWADDVAYNAWQAAALDWQERNTPKSAAGITVASMALAERIASFAVPASRITYLPNCLDPVWAHDDASTPAVADGNTPPAVLYVGYVPRINDLDLLVEALAVLVERRVDFIWRVVGDGPGLDALRGALPEQLRNRTRFLGRIGHDELRTVLQDSRVLCSPLRDSPIARSKCPMKVVDAQAMGVPVVASNVGQHREYIADGETGFLTDPADPLDLSARIEQLLGDRRLAARLGENARRRMRSEYTWDAWIGRLESAYASALSA